MNRKEHTMKNIQDLIVYLSASIETYELVVMPSQYLGLWVAMIRECGPDGMVRIDSDTEAMLLQVADSIPLALEALEQQCSDMLDRISQYADCRIQEDMDIAY